ncbi:histidine phosphatase family protein [Rossellomorea sp. H39__3]
MTTIGLIRHGITEWNLLGKAQGISDIPLNETGREQAGKLGERLAAEEPWDLIIASDLCRATETADIIGSKIGLSLHHTDETIREVNCGEAEGMTEEERLEKWGKEWRSRAIGMEKHEDVAGRGLRFLEDVVQKYEGKRVLVVSHGALIGLTLKRLMPDAFQQTNMENTSITVLHHHEDQWDCSLYNCSKHLI